MHGDMDMSAFSCPYIEGLIEGVQRRANERNRCDELGGLGTALNACKCFGSRDDAENGLESVGRSEASHFFVKKSFYS